VTQQDSGDKSVPPDAGGAGPRDEEQEERIIVRDRRRVDPNGTAPRTGDSAGTGGDADQADADTADKADSAPADADKLRAELDERTRDLKRVVAEYANYRRRVERDRTLAAEQATGAVLASLLPVLDDLDRAREHGDLVGPFGAVAEQLISILSKAGLTPYGEAGDPFDPMHHEAVAHSLSPDVTEPTCVTVLRRGYRHGDRMLRPAMVAVAEPDPDAPKPAEQPEPAAQPAAPDEQSEPETPEDATAEPEQDEPETPAEPAADADTETDAGTEADAEAADDAAEDAEDAEDAEEDEKAAAKADSDGAAESS
jgi:molecular chaperone GrpE